MLRRVRQLPIQIYLWLRRRRSLGLRLALCWLIGLFALSNDETSGYDQRFQLRGSQSPNPDIVVVLLKPSDLRRSSEPRPLSLLTFTEVTDITDSFYWDKRIWRNLLTKVLAQGPRAIGVSLYFGDNIGPQDISDADDELFRNPKIFWSSTLNSMDRALLPLFSNPQNSNIGSHELKRDEDGVVRRVLPQSGDQQHLAERLARQTIQTSAGGGPLVLNYRGSNRVFQSYSGAEILNGHLEAESLKDKIVLIGAETSSGGHFMTPLGPMNRTELLGHLVDNIQGNRWIHRWSNIWYLFILLAFTTLAVFIIMNYPQKVVLVFYLALTLLVAAASTWIFDTFFLWFPVYTPMIILSSVWLIFVGFQASKIERTNFRLQQEQKNLFELEQLKNNFVSLISHDLKTPIAKIQAIVDRLKREPDTQSLSRDLEGLEAYSDELNRYIQSILNLLRVESRDFKLNKVAVDLNEIITQALDQIQPLAQNKQIKIETSLEPLFSLEFDVVLIKEVLINLIENAIKYSPAGQSIKITSQEIDTGVLVTVEDHGEGIPQEEIPKVWGKFYRGQDQSMKSKGSGLGLYLVKYFIELHGGQVSLSSQKNQTQVSFSLPFEATVV